MKNTDDMEPDVRDRQQRFFNALRFREMTQNDFCEQCGFHPTSLLRWIKHGDPKKAATHGRTTSTSALAIAFRLPPQYLTPGGESLFKDERRLRFRKVTRR